MALILQQKESSFRRWYAKNRQMISENRRQRYAQDPEYRQRALEASRRRRRGERGLTKPPEGAPISFAQAAEHIGVSVSTLHEWRRKKLFPEPTHYGGRIWFSETQVSQLKKLREFFTANGRKPRSIKMERLKNVVTSIYADWD
jgi:predicted DNA-binding transcriptional regulator AlpA